MQEYFQPKLSLIEQVNAINPEIAASFVLRTYTWPTAVLHRIGWFLEMGVTIDPLLEYAKRQLEKRSLDSKRVMVDFITEQNTKCDQLSVLNPYRDRILPSTRIHIVDLTDPFSWNTQRAYQRQSLICDLASHAESAGTKTSTAFGMVMDAHNDHFGRCIVDLNQTIKDFRRSR